MAQPKIGTQVNDRYRLDAEIGRGGMGVVYRAHDSVLEREVAIKVLAKTGLGTEGRTRLLNEARAAARLNHPNIVSVYDAGEDRGLSFIVMELVEDPSLFDRKPASLEDVLAIATQICAALEHAHAQGIVHRDLKPENVILASDGSVKLSDFGLARSVASRVTTEGAISGTVFYLSPEQALGKETDGRTDLYALGVMLYEMTAGRLPFTADDPLAVISQHLYAPVLPPSTYNAEIPPVLETLILEMLNKQPDNRPGSAAEVRRRLDDLMRVLRVGGRTTAFEHPRRSPLNQLVPARLVGREREFAEAKALWMEAASAAAEQNVLVISGEPGVGKTPFVREVRTFAEISGGAVLTGECYAEGSAPYAPIAQIIRAALELPGLDLPELVLAGLISITPDLLVRYPNVPPNPSLDPQAEQQRLFESVVALCAALTDRSPVLMVVEDVHWADGGTLFLLRHLARRSRSPRFRLLIIMTYRDVELDDSCCLSDVLLDLNRERLAARIRLTRLGREQTRDLLATMFQEQIAEEFVDAIYRETEGNLFFIEEVCKALVEEGKLQRTNGRWQRPHMAEIHIPQSVRLAIQSRVSKLPSYAQDALRLAAVIGREFDFETLFRSGDLDEDALIAALEAAERAQLIDEMTRSGRETFAFAHGLTMTTLRESVSGLRRRRLHRRVATAIEELRPDDFEALAFHHEQAGDTHRARTYYMRAGDRAVTVYAYQDAERYYGAALEFCKSDSDIASLQAAMGEVLFRQSRFEEAVHIWRQAIDRYQTLVDHDEAARLYARSARAAWYAGDPVRGLELCREGMQAVPDDFESPGMAALLHETARACVFNDLPDEALPLCERALAMARSLGLVEVQADTLATMGILPNQTFEEKQYALGQAVDLAESARLLATASRARFNLGGRLQEQGDLPSARVQFGRAREIARQIGIASWEHDFLVAVAAVSLSLGDYGVVEDALGTLRQLQEAIPDPERAVFDTHMLEGNLAQRRGEWEKAIRLMQECQVKARQQAFPKYLIHINVELADTFLMQGRLDDAEQALIEAVKADDDQPKPTSVTPVSLLGILRTRQGRLEESHQLLERAREQLGAEPNRGEEGLVWWAEGELAVAEGKWPEAFAAYERAAARAAEIGERWYQARVLAIWGDAHLARGEPQDVARARELYGEALELFERLDTPIYAALVRKKLQALNQEGIP